HRRGYGKAKGLMVLPLVLRLALLTQAPVLSAAAAHAAPTINAASVRVWLSDSKFQVGARARVFVNLRDPGYLVVLHADAAGRAAGGDGRGADHLRRLLHGESRGLVLRRDRQSCDEHLSAASRAGASAGLRPLLHPVLRPAAAPVHSGLPAAAPATGDRAGGEPAGAAHHNGPAAPA